jgi:hypothetical protein
MEHPLLPNIDNLSTDELTTKIAELNKKLSIAYRMGNNDLCNQLRMALETYQNKYTEKLRNTQSGTDYDGMIDIN